MEPLMSCYLCASVYQREVDPETGELRTTDKLLTIRRYSDTLLMFLLKWEKPEKYGHV
jgi:hypothetical protein